MSLRCDNHAYSIELFPNGSRSTGAPRVVFSPTRLYNFARDSDIWTSAGNFILPVNQSLIGSATHMTDKSLNSLQSFCRYLTVSEHNFNGEFPTSRTK
jgi:hypothetical protein